MIFVFPRFVQGEKKMANRERISETDNAKDLKGEAALRKAAKDGDSDRARELIDEGGRRQFGG